MNKLDLLCFRIHPDQKIIAYSSEGSINLYDLEKKSPILRFEDVGTQYIPALSFFQYGNGLISCSFDKALRFFDIRQPKWIFKIPNAHKQLIYSIHCSYDDLFLLSGSKDQCIKCFSLQSLSDIPLVALENALDGPIRGLRFLFSSSTKFCSSSSCPQNNLKLFELFS